MSEPTEYPFEQLHLFSVTEDDLEEHPESETPAPLWLDSQEAEDHAPRCKSV